MTTRERSVRETNQNQSPCMGLVGQTRRELTSGTRRRKGTSRGGAQSACTACARAARGRRAASCVARSASTSARLGSAAAVGGPKEGRRRAEVWRGGEGRSKALRVRARVHHVS